MRWWVWAYLMLFIVYSIAGIYDDVLTPYPRWHAVCGVLASACGVTLILAWGVPSLSAMLGFALVPLLLFGLGWESWSAWSDLRILNSDPETSPAVAAFGLLLLAVLVLPAYVLGAAALAREAGAA